MKMLDANNLPDSNFIDGLYKVKATLTDADDLMNANCRMEMYKSESAGKWKRVRNMTNCPIYYDKDSLERSENILAKRVSKWILSTIVI